MEEYVAATSAGYFLSVEHHWPHNTGVLDYCAFSKGCENRSELHACFLRKQVLWRR